MFTGNFLVNLLKGTPISAPTVSAHVKMSRAKMVLCLFFLEHVSARIISTCAEMVLLFFFLFFWRVFQHSSFDMC